MELKWLHDFVSLANTGNFSRSAEERNVTQSAFSRRIRALENWVGAELVSRSAHPVSLTDAGIRFLTSAKYMIQLAASIQEDFQERPPLGRDVIAFSASTNLAMTFLAPWVTGLQQQIGEFDITVQTDISGVHDHFERLRGRLSDFLLHYGHGVELLAMDASKFESVTVGSDVLVPVCHRSFAQAGERILSEENDAPVPYYSPWHTSSIANTIAKTIAESYPYVRLDTRVESSTVGCTRAFVAQGAGVAWLPQSVIEQELAAGEFVRAGDRGFDIPLSIQIYRYLGNTKPAVLRLWEHISGRQPA